MVMLYCVGCKAKVEPVGIVNYEDKQTRKGVKHFAKAQCASGHKISAVVKKE